MKTNNSWRLTLLGFVALALAFGQIMAPGLDAAKRRKRSQPTNAPANVAEALGLFDAIEKGSIVVKYVPKDAKQANLIVQNKTKKPLKIQMPAAFAGVPVLAQFGGGGGMGGGGGGMGGGGGGGGQAGGGGGGGMMGGGGGGMGGGGGGGMFNVAAAKARKIRLATVCLEHGKPDPNPRMKYTIVPIESFTKDQKVIQLCRMLGNGEIPQNAAQAAAWHLMDGMSWGELVQKDRIKLRNGYTEKFFTLREILLAKRIVHEAVSRAEEYEESSPENSLPGKQDSLSRTATARLD